MGKKQQGLGFLGCLGVLILLAVVYYIMAKEFLPQLGVHLPLPGSEKE
jgi:hypothetical protein